ncbi:hypothetical protein SG34_020425 [Thalassomonas viridans]|uniref:Uncharacterized protein n=1 Tax=Thalassomonas viridans TaxID=137584 RepID=A0AAE9Z1Y1_9GAMM|nr:hypothetical protein [Thalassomonas viridans]WDE03728.1 hypothetical protein SG34_020425 [Thalassomonas viridans]
MSYTFWGTLNSLFIIASLYGIYLQLKKIRRRKARPHNPGEVTQILSVRQFLVSFLAYLSFYVYGYSIEPFNHFIVWPRLIAASLVLAVLYHIWHDRRSSDSRAGLTTATLCYALAMAGFMASLIFDSWHFYDHSKNISTALILIITLFLAYGYYAQIRLIRINGSTGAVELKMSLMILLMDISTIAFALSMGLANGWPLLLLACVSGITKIIILYLFRWVRVSESARLRRQQLAG